ncbi:ABC transporter substrate-binding protein [Actinomadura algeriensis]|uniref:Branched-chain amino acid transport system substrate-binding protein n=1 Tax=Actinomadura algeriensis TaxID=1679523 RepID=A0ABR9JZ88_9ACTN|nr:ABC transporter substrate-binding protein [Actinomadura algeriensis]MBE1535885.1 branched-chain amino acid transport system substrate-binding protein [Actinomadura algeriensis]
MIKTRFAAALAALSLLATACQSGDGASVSVPTGVEATGEPIVFGVQAPTKGAAAYPQTGYGVEAAVWYVNNVMGGVGGRPIETDLCAGDGSPETAINCANGFVSADVPFVLDAYDQAITGGVPILAAAGIPLIGTLAGSGVADKGEYGETFYFTGPTEVSAVGSMSVLNDLGKKRIALAVNEAPTSHTYVDALMKPIAGALGMRLDAQYPPATGANYNVTAATQLAGDPDATGVISLPEDGCTSLIQALRRQGYDGTVFAGSCSQFIEQVRDDAAGAIVQPRLWVPLAKEHAPEKVVRQLDDFAGAMKSVGYEDELSARSLYAFAGVVNMVGVMEGMQGAPITAASVTAAMKGLKDFETFAGPAVTCDGKAWPGLPSACSRQAIFFEVRKDGTLAPVHEGGYIELDPSVVPAS